MLVISLAAYCPTFPSLALVMTNIHPQQHRGWTVAQHSTPFRQRAHSNPDRGVITGRRRRGQLADSLDFTVSPSASDAVGGDEGGQQEAASARDAAAREHVQRADTDDRP